MYTCQSPVVENFFSNPNGFKIRFQKILDSFFALTQKIAVVAWVLLKSQDIDV